MPRQLTPVVLIALQAILTSCKEDSAKRYADALMNALDAYEREIRVKIGRERDLQSDLQRALWTERQELARLENEKAVSVGRLVQQFKEGDISEETVFEVLRNSAHKDLSTSREVLELEFEGRKRHAIGLAQLESDIQRVRVLSQMLSELREKKQLKDHEKTLRDISKSLKEYLDRADDARRE